MDRADQPPLSVLGGQLKLGLMEESRKETFFEEILAFVGNLFSYLKRRFFTFLISSAKILLSGFTLSSYFKFWLSRKFVRQKGQLSFPFAHATLVGVSLSLLVTTGGLGEFLYEKTSQVSNDFGAAVLESKTELATEESKLLRSVAIEHTVVEGETLTSVAEFYRIPSPTLVDANRKILPPPYQLAPGMKLVIPAPSGTVIRLAADTTAAKLAGSYGAIPQDIIEYNYLFPDQDGQYRLYAGQAVVLPIYEGGFIGSAAAPTGECGELKLAVWPASSRNIFGSFIGHARSLGFAYAGVDITASMGEELFAAAEGMVVRVGTPSAWNTGYGGSVFINFEGTGYQIRYAHLSEVLVAPGQKVSAGEVVGKAGATGWAYGPHLHFELLCKDKKIDPSFYFPR